MAFAGLLFTLLWTRLKWVLTDPLIVDVKSQAGHFFASRSVWTENVIYLIMSH